MMKLEAPQRIAIIGSGISGLGASYLLSPRHRITLYEKADYIGGHTRTKSASIGGEAVPVDTGFIVMNERCYPLLTGLFNHLNVALRKSDMSFGVSIRDGWLEYGTRTLSHLFGQKRNLLRPAFLRMIRDILRFNKTAWRYLDDPRKLTLGECLDEMKMGSWFREYYLLAMGGAIWSCPLNTMLGFPAESFLRFFDNHGLLTVNDQPQWYTVVGGSNQYIPKLTETFKSDIRLSSPVLSVERDADGVTVRTESGAERYDQVVFACHADQALAMLAEPSVAEQDILGAFGYQKNRAVLHEDITFMPRRRACWSSWVYLLDEAKNGAGFSQPQVSLTYWMNNLQGIAPGHPLLVTLNPGREPAGVIHDEHWFTHPLFDRAAIDAQARIPELQGQNRSWFCGAYQRYGFHEDGLWSAVRMAEGLGVVPSWG